MHSGLFLDFLAGNQSYECTPWGMPARNIFGWQKPCYLLGEGYAKTFKELMDTTDWDTYGTGKYEKCADCMAHCGYEPTAANRRAEQPAEGDVGRAARRSAPRVRWRPEIDISKQRPAQYIFSSRSRRSSVRDPPRRGAPPRPAEAAANRRLPPPPERNEPSRSGPPGQRTGPFLLFDAVRKSRKPDQPLRLRTKISAVAMQPRVPMQEAAAAAQASAARG